MKKSTYFIMPVVIIIFVGGVWWSRLLSETNSNVISTNSIHWHPKLEIYIMGEKQIIPQNVGLLAGHSPIHTHEDLPVIHLEFSGRVTQDDIHLSKFFDVWGKTFTSECIFEYCNGESGQVSMFVNGKENTEFEDYVMSDGDNIEIRFE